MLEQHARELPVSPAILAERRVFELHHVDLAQIHLPMQPPLEFLARELAHRMRQNRTELLLLALRSHQILNRRNLSLQLLVRLSLPCIIEQDEQMQIAQPRQFKRGLVHEDAAAMHRRTNRIG